MRKTWYDLAVIGALIVGIVYGALLMAWTSAPDYQPVATYDAAHAQACRVLHAIAHTERERAEAVLACEHRNPDAWLGSVNVESAREGQ